MKRILLIGILAGLGNSVAAAGITSLPSIKHHPREAYYAGEMTFDFISVYVDPQLSETKADDYAIDEDTLAAGFGGGVAASYFYTENFGIAIRAYWWDTATVLTSLTGSAVYRYPINQSGFAPYAFVGGGGHFDSEESFGSVHAGIGLEYRLTDRVGLIADYTYTWGENTIDWSLYTLGLRLQF
jgi:hypothetical protein